MENCDQATEETQLDRQEDEATRNGKRQTPELLQNREGL